MFKEHTKITRQIFDEDMNPKTEVKETIITSLVADTGMKIKSLEDGVLATRIDIGTEDSEDNYIEVDDPDYIEVIDAIVEEVSGS